MASAGAGSAAPLGIEETECKVDRRTDLVGRCAFRLRSNVGLSSETRELAMVGYFTASHQPSLAENTLGRGLIWINGCLHEGSYLVCSSCVSMSSLRSMLKRSRLSTTGTCGGWATAADAVWTVPSLECRHPTAGEIDDMNSCKENAHVGELGIMNVHVLEFVYFLARFGVRHNEK